MDGGFARASLIEILEVERDCCSRLSALVADERRAVARRDLTRLLDAVKEREVLQALWKRAAGARAAKLASAGESASALAARDPELARLLAEIRTTANALSRAQRSNAAIVQGALGQVGDLLTTLRRAQPGSRYDDHAAMTAPLPSLSRAGWSA